MHVCKPSCRRCVVCSQGYLEIENHRKGHDGVSIVYLQICLLLYQTPPLNYSSADVFSFIFTFFPTLKRQISYFYVILTFTLLLIFFSLEIFFYYYFFPYIYIFFFKLYTPHILSSSSFFLSSFRTFFCLSSSLSFIPPLMRVVSPLSPLEIVIQ